ncbi:MAG: hypothetical protein HY360_09010, partial [Verrucomicrobia bacterium]|nr:hypothetical protein [Verrucomicrobiota bacterium]
CYRGGIERGVYAHGGKNNRFEGITIFNVGIGIEVGGLFGPDLVGATFINTTVTNVRIGYRLMGCNVTSMVFINPLVAEFEEAGFQIKAFGGRQIRVSKDEPIVQRHADGRPGVLMDPDEEREIFQTDLPAWLSAPGVTYPTWWSANAAGKRVLWAGGGNLDVTIYGLLAHSSHLNSWVIDTNWGLVRVYSARIEGMGGIFRSSVPMAAGNYANVLMDMATTSAGGLNGNAIELHGEGPLYLIGGTYRANIALGGRSLVYAFGARFETPDSSSEALLPLGYDRPLDQRIKRTGETRAVSCERGQAEMVRVTHPRNPGFINLPGSHGARVHELTQSARMTVSALKEQTSVEVKLAGMAVQPDANYQVAVTPNFNAGGVWVSRKQRDSITVNFNHPAPPGATLDVLISHDPFRGTGKP